MFGDWENKCANVQLQGEAAGMGSLCDPGKNGTMITLWYIFTQESSTSHNYIYIYIYKTKYVTIYIRLTTYL